MDANDLLLGHGGQSQWIDLTQVRLFGERQLLEIFLGLNVRKIDALELLRIEGRTLLQRLELLLDEENCSSVNSMGLPFRVAGCLVTLKTNRK